MKIIEIEGFIIANNKPLINSFVIGTIYQWGWVLLLRLLNGDSDKPQVNYKLSN